MYLSRHFGQYAPDLAAGIAAILQRLEIIEADLATVKIDVKISNAIGSNQRIIARNAQNQPLYEPLQKTVSFINTKLTI